MLFYRRHVQKEVLLMKNPDTRVQFTKSRFHQTLAELLEEKAIGFISVKELCDRAGLNRGTFYLHYAEPMDVLHELEDRLSNKIMENYSGMEDILTDRLRLVLTERKAYAAILGSHGEPAFLVRACRLAYQAMKPYFRAEESASEDEPPEEFQFAFSGCTWLICRWLASNDPIPPEQMAKKLLLMSNSVFDTQKNRQKGDESEYKLQ